MNSNFLKKVAACMLALAPFCGGTAFAQSAEGHPDWPGAGQLFVGTCYQPVDRSREQIQRDIELMRQAGLQVVRMGDLSWDYFEPAEGRFDFATFDWIMDRMHAAGIKVILDIPGQPAPIWLHHRYPGVDIVTQQGARLHAAERYMDNIGDPDYRRLLARMADTLTRRYAQHPALFAVGFNNEIGNGYLSYSPADRERFVEWLKKRYGSIEALNKAWATQRWSRHINSWDEVELPYVEGPGPSERYLDLRRYWSDTTIDVLRELESVRKKNVPDKPVISNLWDGAGRKGFDYLATQREYASYGAMGFYPEYYGDPPVGTAFDALMIKGGLSTPIWFNEFTTGSPGVYGTKGRSRMWAHFGLLLGAQTALAWTFNTHLGGEEQTLFGLIDHDDRPSWKLQEWATIAGEFAKLQARGFPRQTRPKIAIAYSFDNRIASSAPGDGVRRYITTPYIDQAHNALEPLLKDNIDAAVVNIAHEDLSRYRLVVVPGLYLLDQAGADALRKFVADGGTAIMTAFSAKVDEHSQWYDTPLPGRLSDVFGLRTSEFYRTGTTVAGLGDRDIESKIAYYEVLEPSTAETMARFSNVDGTPPAISVNRFGKGRAIYVATPAQPQIMGPLYRQLYASLGIEPGPKTPGGVYAREVDGRVLYVNTTSESREVAIGGTMHGALSGKRWSGTLRLEPLGVDLLEKR
ncbi:MAG TPA: beta-galactosidase [Pseudoxanthomonas sp.]|nr:beta-galactosidase [Pseudoxanthomonas sp.]